MCFTCVSCFPTQQFYRLVFTFQVRKQLLSYPTAVMMLLYSDKGKSTGECQWDPVGLSVDEELTVHFIFRLVAHVLMLTE